jgi:hypothetical protein
MENILQCLVHTENHNYIYSLNHIKLKIYGHVPRPTRDLAKIRPRLDRNLPKTHPRLNWNSPRSRQVLIMSRVGPKRVLAKSGQVPNNSRASPNPSLGQVLGEYRTCPRRVLVMSHAGSGQVPNRS